LAIEAFTLDPALVGSETPWVESRSAAARAPRIDFGGTRVHQVDLTNAVERMREFALSGRPHRAVTVNLDFLSLAERNPEFRSAINSADLAVADGMPLVWVSRLRGTPIPARVTGVELVHAGCELAIEMHRGIFLLGARPGIGLAAAGRLKQLHPGLRIAGVFAPPPLPLSKQNQKRALELINAAAPAFLFVAFGAPRQDLWIAEHLDQLNVGMAMGVGGVLDLFAGLSSRAPGWMQTAGLEWAYRLGREPRRLWRRYFFNDLPTLARLVLDTGRGPTPGPIVAST
jgi:N-acetylglucosaminyldiphosphoundecaprenol N-acetyl-beta-D-mannosaminyltransferase